MDEYDTNKRGASNHKLSILFLDVDHFKPSTVPIDIWQMARHTMDMLSVSAD